MRDEQLSLALKIFYKSCCAMLLHDNSHSHDAAMVNSYIDGIKIQQMNWRLCKPDSCFIEILKGFLNRRVREKTVYFYLVFHISKAYLTDCDL